MLRRSIVPLLLLAAFVFSGCEPVEPAVLQRTVRVPTSIDATGATDVSASLATFLATVPDQSVIEFAPGGQYRIESTFWVRQRTGLTFDGNDALIFATTPGDRERTQMAIEGGSDILVKDLRVRGANPAAGAASNEAFQLDKEAQHGFDIMGVQGMELRNVTVTDTYGDFVHITREYNGDWADDVLITGSHFERNGRQGIAMVAARNVVIEGNSLSDMRRATFDLEPGRGPGWGVDNVVIRDNDIGVGRLFFIAAAGDGPVNNVTVEGNRLRGIALQIWMVDKAGGIRHNWKVLNNTSDRIHNNRDLAPMRFWRVDGLEVHGNTQPFTKGSVMYGVRAEDSCKLALDGNTYANATGQSILIGGC